MTYYPIWIAAGGHKIIRRGPDCDTAAAAAAVCKEKIGKELSSLAAVVQVDDGGPQIMETYVWPTSARRVIRHYLDMLDWIDAQ